jgi:hypothetical protein
MSSGDRKETYKDSRQSGGRRNSPFNKRRLPGQKEK